MTKRRSLPVLVGLLLAVLAVLPLAPTATAGGQKACWERLIDDWYDGRIDGTYPVRCYREAQRNMPRDVEEYSSLSDDLERALQSALTSGGGPPGPNTLVPPGPGRDTAASNGEQSAGGPPIDGEDNKRSPFFGLGPSNADSIPIPILVLAALAMLLLAAAAASFLARRLQARRAPVTPDPRPRTPRP